MLSNIIVIEFPLNSANWKLPIKEALGKAPENLLFDPEQCALCGVRFRDFGRWAQVGIYNAKLPLVPDHMEAPVYSPKEAAEAFPFLLRPPVNPEIKEDNP